MGRKRITRSTLSGILLLWLLSFTFQGCTPEKAESDTGQETTTAPSDKQEAEVTQDEPEVQAGVDSPRGTPLLISKGDKVRVRKEPNQKGEVLALLARNELFISLGEETESREKITINKFTFDSPWLKVRVPGQEDVEGWVYGAFDRDNGLVEWLVRESALMQQEEQGRELHSFNLEKQEKVASTLGFDGMTYQDTKGFSGYCYRQNNVLDGPFYLVTATANDKVNRIVIEGSYTDGKIERAILSHYTPPVTSNLELKIEGGACTGREYRKFKGTKRILKYSDGECSFDESTLSYDL